MLYDRYLLSEQAQKCNIYRFASVYTEKFTNAVITNSNSKFTICDRLLPISTQIKKALFDELFLLPCQSYGAHYIVKSEVRPHLRFLKDQHKRVFYLIESKRHTYASWPSS